MRCEEIAGSRTEQVFFRHPAARLQGMPWHGLVGRRGFCFASNSAFGSRKARTGRVLAGKSWPHLLNGDTQLSAKEVSSIR